MDRRCTQMKAARDCPSQAQVPLVIDPRCTQWPSLMGIVYWYSAVPGHNLSVGRSCPFWSKPTAEQNCSQRTRSPARSASQLFPYTTDSIEGIAWKLISGKLRLCKLAEIQLFQSPVEPGHARPHLSCTRIATLRARITAALSPKVENERTLGSAGKGQSVIRPNP